jgi:hypothetical protein
MDALQDQWLAEGRIRLIAPGVARSLSDPAWDPREHLSETAAIVDLTRDARGFWRGEAGVGLVVAGQAPSGEWEVSARGEGRLQLKTSREASSGCWTSGSRTVADVIVITPRRERARGSIDPGGWWASMCGIRYPVVVFSGREERSRRWKERVLDAITAGLEVEGCELRSVGCDPDHLAARCGDRWVLPAPARVRTFSGPDPGSARCGRGPLADTGVEVPDPCTVPPGDVPDCRHRPYKTPDGTFDPEPQRARPYIRWCGQHPEAWLGPGLHPPYRPGRPHGSVSACWKRALLRDPTACGEFTAVVRLTSGAATQVESVAETVGDEDLARCLHRALEEWAPAGPADTSAIRVRAFLRNPGPNVPVSAEPPG